MAPPLPSVSAMIQGFLRHRVSRGVIVAAMVFASGRTPATAALPVLEKLDGALQELLASPLSSLTNVRVIVSAKPGQLSSLILTLRLSGLPILAEHPLIDGVTILVPRLTLPVLSALNLVQSISLDAPTRALWSEGETTTGDRLRGTLGLTGSSFTGAGIGVAVVDSGIHPASVFGGRISAFYDFTGTGKAVAKAPYDNYGHGTHVAGLIGGSATPSNGNYAGVAPGVRLIGLKVLDGNGGGYTSHVISAIEFAIKNRAALGIHVVNLSLGHPIYERAGKDPLVRAVELAVQRGLIVVVSAGNYGTSSATGEIAYGGITSPANARSAITVGAVNTQDSVTRSDDRVAPYSSRGPTWYDGFSKPDLVAPGHALTAAVGNNSTLWNSYPALRATPVGSGGYMRLNGTSMAAAVASGVVALTLEAHYTSAASSQPTLTPNIVKAMLQYTALPVGPDGQPLSADDRLAYGAGGINAAGATELARRVEATTPRGDPWLTSGLTPTSVIDGQTLVWEQHIVWGDHIVWGESVYFNQPAFSPGVAWGTHIVWGDHVVWGDHTVWGAGRTWGSHIVWGDTWIGRTDGEHIVWGDTHFAEDTVAWRNLSTSRTTPANTLASGSVQQ